MDRVVRHLSSSLPFFRRPNPGSWLGQVQQISSSLGQMNQMEPHQQQWSRGIRVRVKNGNLEQALSVMERKMTSSGMERLIKRQTTHHLKNSEKRVLARKNLERRIKSEELARKLRTILVKKIRGL